MAKQDESAKHQHRKGQPSQGRHETPASVPSRTPDSLPFPNSQQKLPQLSRCCNAGLLFDRYTRFLDDWQLGEYSINSKKKESAKLFNLKQVASAQERCKGDEAWMQLHQQLIVRWSALVNRSDVATFKLTPECRFVTGLGNKTALEVGFTFHRIYGFPIIPGSSLKGLARAAALWEIGGKLGIPALTLSETRRRLDKPKPDSTPMERLAEMLLADDERVSIESRNAARLQEKEKETLANLLKDKALPNDAPIRQSGLEPFRGLVENFRRIFGTTHAEGQAVFFDAVPTKPPKLEVDVMNVHYGEYYQESYDDPHHPPKTPPADYLNPNPIPFLTVGRTPFWFAVGWRGKDPLSAQQQAIKWLKQGLMNMGAGAKTSAGYGYFK